MLTFFRKIRQGLIAERTIPRYFLYAVGEIALVVIGILIALQINNWNEGKKSNTLKQDYLIKLESDIDQDITDVAYWIQINDKYTQEGFYLLDFLENRLDHPDTLRLKRSLSLTQTGTPFPLNAATYKDLVNSGNMKLIRDLNFKGMLDNYYSNSAGTLPIREANRRSLWFDYAHELNKHYDPLLHRTMMIESVPWAYSGEADLSAHEADWESMRKSTDLLRYLKVLQNHRAMMEINYKTDLERAKGISEYMVVNGRKL